MLLTAAGHPRLCHVRHGVLPCGTGAGGGRGPSLRPLERTRHPASAVGGRPSLVPAALCALAVPALRAGHRKDLLCRADSADGSSAAPSPPQQRRRRRRRRPAPAAAAPEPLLGDLVLAEKVRHECDCEHILGTVVEVSDVLEDYECEYLISDAHATAEKIGGWGVEKHVAHTTQDVKIWKMSPQSVGIFRERLVAPMTDVIAQEFRIPRSVVKVDDGFVVQYTKGRQESLAFHRDGSVVSGIVSLSRGSDYGAGGTVFRDGNVYRPEKGSGILFAGQREHSGVQITEGTRYICTLFFRCGALSCRDLAVEMDREVMAEQGGGLQDVFKNFFN